MRTYDRYVSLDDDSIALDDVINTLHKAGLSLNQVDELYEDYRLKHFDSRVEAEGDKPLGLVYLKNETYSPWFNENGDELTDEEKKIKKHEFNTELERRCSALVSILSEPKYNIEKNGKTTSAMHTLSNENADMFAYLTETAMQYDVKSAQPPYTLVAHVADSRKTEFKTTRLMINQYFQTLETAGKIPAVPKPKRTNPDVYIKKLEDVYGPEAPEAHGFEFAIGVYSLSDKKFIEKALDNTVDNTHWEYPPEEYPLEEYPPDLWYGTVDDYLRMVRAEREKQKQLMKEEQETLEERQRIIDELNKKPDEKPEPEPEDEDEGYIHRPPKIDLNLIVDPIPERDDEPEYYPADKSDNTPLFGPVVTPPTHEPILDPPIYLDLNLLNQVNPSNENSPEM